VLSKGRNDSLIAESWIQEKPCHVTIDTEASLTIARPDIVAGQPKRQPSRPYVLQMASRETFPVLKEVLEKLTQGRSALNISPK
jgi:hypothetical protein